MNPVFSINPGLLGMAMITVFMALIMTKRMSAITALIIVPVVFGLLAGAGAGLGEMMVKGVIDLAPTALMLAFAVLYFGIMIDAGLFDPLVRLVLRTVGDDPVRVTVGTALLALVVSLDGDGATTALVTISALLPVYRRLGMNPLILGTLLGLSIAITGMTPWAGPTARAASALKLDPGDIFLPMIPAMLIGAVFVMALAWAMGRSERKRIGVLTLDPVVTEDAEREALTLTGDIEDKRPRLIWFNLLLTLLLVGGLLFGVAPLPALMMLAFGVALIVNYRQLDVQRRRIAAHANNVVNIVLLIFAAGAFTGILGGTGMVDAMAAGLVAAIPPALGPYMAPITALVSMPLTFFMSNDAFYFGVLPVIAETGAHYGVAPVTIARASLTALPIHVLSPLVAAIYLVCGLLKVDVGESQRFSLNWMIAGSLVLILGALATGAFPLRVG